MMTRFGLVLLYAILSPSVAVAGATITSADTGYSVTFPVQPRKELTTKKGLNLALYLVREGDNIFASQEGFYSEIKDVQAELEADLAKFVKQLDSEITFKRNADFITTAGTALPARQFSFEGPNSLGRELRSHRVAAPVSSWSQPPASSRTARMLPTINFYPHLRSTNDPAMSRQCRTPECFCDDDSWRSHRALEADSR
jgi:hypothetical protein